MWKEMKSGDLALFYHSNAKPPGVVGIAKVVGDAYPDPTQFDPSSEYFDPKASEDQPRWWLVDFRHVKTFPEMISLAQLKEDPALSDMVVCQKGSRLSITPVAAADFRHIENLASA